MPVPKEGRSLLYRSDVGKDACTHAECEGESCGEVFGEEFGEEGGHEVGRGVVRALKDILQRKLANRTMTFVTKQSLFHLQ